MKIPIGLLISIFLHASIGISLYVFNDNIKHEVKNETTSLRVKIFSLEEPKSILKKAVHVEKKQLIKPKVIKKKTIKKKQKIVKKVPIKKVTPKKEIPKKIKNIIPKEVKKETPKEIEVHTEQLAKTPINKNKTINNKVNTPVKKVEKKKLLTDYQIQDFLKQVHHIIHQYKSYPSRAKKMHIQGEVIASFTLFSSGEISDIKIIQSSGAKFLDEHTIETIIEASSSFPKPPSQINMRIPISYFLR